ncbi:hypothetical protein F3Q92_20945 [Salmonella enterica subsp. enterica]|nr:hypothetical protein [Salmonella enterica subsp. enterica]HBR3685983.1 hypothetical protein [Klebsiella pneumoniae]
MNTDNTQNILMDSPEALGHALCNLVPEMVHGFRVVTPSGEICVPAQEAHPFVLTMEVMLMQQIRRLQNQSALRPAVAPQPVNTVVKACDGETLRDLARKIAARIG